MRILTRYILREVTSHALIGAAIFTFVLFTRDLGRILELVVRASAPLPSVAGMFLYTVPLALTYTIPMSVLVGILIGLSRLAADSEITAMRASGMGVWSFGRVLAIFVAAAWALALLNGLYLAPWSLASLGHLEDQLKGSQVSYEVQPRVFYEGFPKTRALCAGRTQRARRRGLEGRFSGRHFRRRQSAHHAGSRRHSRSRGSGPPAPALDRRLHARNRSRARPTITRFLLSSRPTSPSSWLRPRTNRTNKFRTEPIGTWALHERAASVDPVTARLYLIEFHNRFALPTACLVLAMVGIPLGLSSKKSGKSGGFVLTIVLVFVYYFVSLIGVSLAKQGSVSPMFGAWLANFVFFAAALFLLWQAERRPLSLSAIRLAWKRDEVHRISRRTFLYTSAGAGAESPPTLSSAPPRGAESSAPASPRCSMTTCCAIFSSTWE